MTIDPPILTSTAAQQAAVVPLQVTLARMQAEFPPAIQEVLAAVTKQQIGPAGPLFTRILATDGASFTLEIGFPVHRAVRSSGRVVPGGLPAAQVARTTYRGGYDGLGAAWGELRAWASERGLAPEVGMWECYVAGPESGPDPAQWRTELFLAYAPTAAEA